MKQYIVPQTRAIVLKTRQQLMGASGVTNGGKLGKSYNVEDVSYSRKTNDFWED